MKTNTDSNFILSARSANVEERSVVLTYMSTADHEARQLGNQKGDR
jgi:hypothetical protein